MITKNELNCKLDLRDMELKRRINELESKVNRLDDALYAWVSNIMYTFRTGIKWHYYEVKLPKVGRFIIAICNDNHIRRGIYTNIGLECGWGTWIGGFKYWAYLSTEKKEDNGGPKTSN